jgi:hypothetical protein
MKSGVVDGMETWPGAAAGFGMTAVTAQAIELDFGPGTASVFINSRSMDRMPGRLQDVMREASRRGSEASYNGLSTAMNTVTGNGPSPTDDSDYIKRNETMRHVRLSEEELDTFRERGAVEQNGAIYGEVRKELDRLAGLDVFGAIAEYEKKVRGQPLNAQAWWS